jgi:hypothetical protein
MLFSLDQSVYVVAVAELIAGDTLLMPLLLRWFDFLCSWLCVDHLKQLVDLYCMEYHHSLVAHVLLSSPLTHQDHVRDHSHLMRQKSDQFQNPTSLDCQ